MVPTGLICPSAVSRPLAAAKEREIVFLRSAASEPVVAAEAFPVVTKKDYLCPG
jgi:hypothetical protein